MARKYFGTDGIRGRANGTITPELALKVGQAAGLVFRRGDYRNRVLIGKDTRLSGYMIETALVAGFTSVGLDVFQTGPMPTPAVAMLTRSMRADLGVMISASHNPYDDNGIKLFGPDGFKLSDEVEYKIEELVDSELVKMLAKSADLGRARRIDDGQGRYVEFAKRTLPRNLSLDGLRVVVDCANGAAYKVAPQALWELGAEVISLGVEPDGFNINRECGSTEPAPLCRKVKEMRADIGIALDGDGDRVLIVDERGHIVDGDQLLAVIAESWKADGRLEPPLAFENVGDVFASDRALNHVLDIGDVQSIARGRLAIDRNIQVLLTAKLFDLRIAQPSNPACDSGDFVRVVNEDVKIVPEQLNSYVGADAGHHLINTVGNRLGYHEVHAGNVFQPAPHLCRVVRAGEWFVWLFDLEELAQGFPACLYIVDEQPVLRNAPLYLNVVSLEDLDGVSLILEAAVEGTLPDDLARQVDVS